MIERRAACNCGQLHLVARGSPSESRCATAWRDKRRTGSAFAVQARFPSDHVRIEGRATEYVRFSDSGEARTFHFCPECGGGVVEAL